MNKPAYPPPPAAARAQTGRGGAGRSRGYTLIELMIVVTVLGILTALAVPSYLNYVTESARSDAMISLTTMAARQELYFSNNGKYALEVADLGYPPPDPSLGNNQIWSEDKDQHYRISTLSCIPPRNDCFQLAAEAWHGVALKDTECARFELDSFGRRRAKDSGSVATDDCWN